jgi:hypothetical protein
MPPTECGDSTVIARASVLQEISIYILEKKFQGSAVLALTVRLLQTDFIDQVFHEVRFGLKYFLTSDKHSMFILPKTSMNFMPVGSKNLTRWHTLTAARRQLVRENIAT